MIIHLYINDEYYYHRFNHHYMNIIIIKNINIIYIYYEYNKKTNI